MGYKRRVRQHALTCVGSARYASHPGLWLCEGKGNSKATPRQARSACRSCLVVRMVS